MGTPTRSCAQKEVGERVGEGYAASSPHCRARVVFLADWYKMAAKINGGSSELEAVVAMVAMP